MESARREIGSAGEDAPAARAGVDLPAVGWCAAAVAAVALLYLPSLTNGFAFDDRFVVTDVEPFLRDPALLPRLFTTDYFALSGEATWRPLVTATYVLDRHLGGGSPFVFHLHNLLWHLATCALVARVITAVLPAGQRRARLAAAGALLFGAHPVLTEAVDGVAFREDVMAAALGLAATVVSLRTGRGSVLRAASTALLFLAALAAKESAAVFLLLAPLVWWAHDRAASDADGAGDGGSLPGGLSARRPAVVAVGIATLSFAVLRLGVFASPAAYAEPAGGTRLTAVASGLAAIPHYLRLLVFPRPLCVDYRGVVPPSAGAADLRSWAGLAIVVAAVAAALWLRRRRPAVALGVCWFLVALLPASNLVPIPVFMAERFLYLPWVGGTIAVVAALRGLAGQRVAFTVLLVLAAVPAPVTWRRHAVWRDDLALWGRTIADFPDSPGALHGYAGALQEEERWEESVPLLERALDLGGLAGHERASVLEALGTAHGVAGRVDESVRVLELAVSIEPRAESLYHLGVGWMLQGDPPRAERAMRDAIALRPHFAPPYRTLAEMAAQRGDTGASQRLMAEYERLTGGR